MDVLEKVRIAADFFSKVKGLLGKSGFQGVIVLAPCNDIHTFGMHEDIDIAFADREGSVLMSMRSIPPRKRIKCKKGYAVIERISQEDKAWFEVGDQVGIAVMKTGEGRRSESVSDLQVNELR